MSSCFYDAISLSKETPARYEDFSSFYQSVSGYPRLVLTKEGGKLEIDITGRFTHNETSCSYSNYRIAYVLDEFDTKLSDIAVLQTYQLSITGTLEISGGAQTFNHH